MPVTNGGFRVASFAHAIIGDMIREQRTALTGRVIRYLEAGLGRPLLLLHAFPLGADMWRPQLERVPRGWRFIAPDLRGLGGSTLDGDHAVVVEDYAHDAFALLDDLRLERAVIGGLSLGGYVTMAMHRREPGRFAGILLADTKAAADSDEGRRGRRVMLDTVRSGGVPAIVDEMLGKLAGETSRRERPEIIAGVRQMIASAPQAGVEAAIYALMHRPDATAGLSTIACPALVVVGEEDRVTPLADAEALHRSIAGSQLATVPRAGHLSNLEAADEFSTTITGWLASLPQ